MAFREPGAFNREDLKLLKVLAGQVAVAVDSVVGNGLYDAEGAVLAFEDELVVAGVGIVHS